jgi:hypothetical protein
MNFQIYTMYVNRKDVLVQALRALGHYQERVVVLDNSFHQDLSLDEFPGEIFVPSSPLYCNQSYNLMQRLAERRGQEAYFIMHSDALASPRVVDAVLARAAELNGEGRRWGTIFTDHDVLCLMNTPLLTGLHWDQYLPLYYTDVDYYRRMELAGLEIVETYLPVGHQEGGSTTQSDPVIQLFVQINYPAWRHYYMTKWGGERGQETYTEPFNGQYPDGKRS